MMNIPYAAQFVNISKTGLVMVNCKKYDKKPTIYNDQTSLWHLLQTKLHIQYLTCDKQKDMFNIYIYDLYI